MGIRDLVDTCGGIGFVGHEDGELCSDAVEGNHIRVVDGTSAGDDRNVVVAAIAGYSNLDDSIAVGVERYGPVAVEV